MSNVENKKNYLCKVKLRKPDEDGVESNVNEQYLVEAYNYSEAEERVNELMEGYTFTITAITKTNIVEVHSEEDQQNWKVKVAMVTFDDESGKEKSANFYMLVGEDNISRVYAKVMEVMADSGIGFSILSITHTKIVEVHSL